MSTFEGPCPATPPEPEARIDDDAIPPGLPEAGRSPVPGDTAPGVSRAPRMLIVEDAPLIALDLAETMKDLGFEVSATAFTHEQALAEIERSVPDYAVIDLHLGVRRDVLDGRDGRDGETLLSMLAARGCRCLVFSGDDSACRRVAERFPRFSVLAKPAQPEALAREIDRSRARYRPATTVSGPASRRARRRAAHRTSPILARNAGSEKGFATIGEERYLSGRCVRG